LALDIQRQFVLNQPDVSLPSIVRSRLDQWQSRLAPVTNDM
jgi:hypothetical protein